MINSYICPLVLSGRRWGHNQIGKRDVMFNRTAKVPKVTWKTILVNPFILGTMAIPLNGDGVLVLVATGITVAISGLMPLGIPRVPLSVSIACYIIFALGCAIGGLGLVNILEHQFPNYPTVSRWKWVQWLSSAFENLAILIWVYVVLNISPVNRSLYISTVFVAAAVGYSLTSDAFAIRDAIVFGVTREVTDWEQGVEFLLSGCALVVWARLIIRKLASTSAERMIGSCTLFVGATLILGSIFFIVWDIFT